MSRLLVAVLLTSLKEHRREGFGEVGTSLYAPAPVLPRTQWQPVAAPAYVPQQPAMMSPLLCSCGCEEAANSHRVGQMGSLLFCAIHFSVCFACPESRIEKRKACPDSRPREDPHGVVLRYDGRWNRRLPSRRLELASSMLFPSAARQATAGAAPVGTRRSLPTLTRSTASLPTLTRRRPTASPQNHSQPTSPPLKMSIRKIHKKRRSVSRPTSPSLKMNLK